MESRTPSYVSMALYAVIGIVLFIFFILCYTPVATGLNGEDLTILASTSIVGLFLFQYFLGTHLLRRAFVAPAVVGLLWALTFPLLYHWSYSQPFYFYEFAMDYLFGLLVFVGLITTHLVCSLKKRFNKTIAFIFAFCEVLLCIIPFAQIAYYISTWHCLTPQSLMAIYMTNPSEASEYLRNMMGIGGGIGVLVALLVLIFIFAWCNMGIGKIVDGFHRGVVRNWLLVILFLFSWGYTPLFLTPQTCIVANLIAVHDYLKQIQQYDVLHANIYKTLKLNPGETAAQKVPGTIILVIGESTSRNYMKVYTPSFPYDDTPWQSEMIHNPNFIFFRHAYSSYVQTVPTLERALTERNQYDDKPFLQSTNILDVARKAGYYTTWLSNQGVYGQYDTAISLVAKTAEHTKWAHHAYVFTDKYDGALLPLLKTEVDPHKNNFLVIHIMGSHIYYNDRYPSSFSKWKDGAVPRGKEAYANSQLYTDWVLQQIFTYAKEHLNLQAMVYFSDHGESIKRSHNPDVFEFEMTRIPFWVYLSPAYQKAYPETMNLLRSRQAEYFTNDLLYDFLIGLMHAPSNRYDPSRDFSNKAYRFNKNNLKTMLGTRPLTQDPEVNI